MNVEAVTLLTTIQVMFTNTSTPDNLLSSININGKPNCGQLKLC